MYKILLFTDSKWRDLPGTALLKYHLQKVLPSAIVEISSYLMWKPALEAYQPHLVVLNHIQGRRNKIIADYVKRHGGLVVVQFNEGIVDFDGQDNIFRNQKGHKDVDMFLCWNDIVSKLVDGTVVGCPRFDLYSKPYKKLIDSKELFCDKHGLNASAPLIVFGDSFPNAKFAYSMKGFHARNWNDLETSLTLKWDSAEALAQDQYDKQELFKFIIKRAASKLRSRAQVVVSTHPMSDFVVWQRWGKDNNINVLGRDHIFNTLNAADVYVSKLGSLSVSEAWLGSTHTITLGREDTGAALDQHKANPSLTAGLRGNHEDIVGLIDRTLGTDFSLGKAKKDYLDKWGFVSSDASRASAQALVDLLIDRQPAATNGSHLKLWLSLLDHDSGSKDGKLDGYGNWDKTITQFAVNEWMTKLKLFLD